MATLVSFQHHLTRSLSVYGEGQGDARLAGAGGDRVGAWHEAFGLGDEEAKQQGVLRMR